MYSNFQLGKDPMCDEALNVLGFPSDQIVENTSEDEIGKAFLFQMKKVFVKRKQKNDKKNKLRRYVNLINYHLFQNYILFKVVAFNTT